MEIVKINKITKLKEVYDRYDLTVSTTNNFFANGLLITLPLLVVRLR